MSSASCFGRKFNEAEKLLLCMAPVAEVVETFRSDVSKSTIDHLDSESVNELNEQNAFVDMVERSWTEFYPADRYMKRLVTRYVNLLEEFGVSIESESLLALILRVSHSGNCMPDPEQACYLSFHIPKTQGLLRIRVFPYHNDVALRLWEAGATLSEFFLQHPSMLAGRSVIELGAGVGVTGLVIAACCKPMNVHLTDYSYECRINLEHNIQANEEWLSRCGFCARNLSQGHLEWDGFFEAYKYREHVDCQYRESLEPLEANFDASLKAFLNADVLIAADVIYDMMAMDSLIALVNLFLLQSSSTKEAVFAITKRNVVSFGMFLDRLKKRNIFCDWLANGDDCEALPHVFKCSFAQSRADIRIARLTMSSIYRKLH